MKLRNTALGISLFFSVVCVWLFLLVQTHAYTALRIDVIDFLAGLLVSLPFSDAANMHMLDVQRVLNSIRILFALSVPFSVIALQKSHSRKLAGSILLIIPIVVAVVPWSLAFTIMHAVLFPQGNWVFPHTSLLIQTYPMGFFIGFAATWGILCVLSGTGLLFFKKSRA